LSNHQAMRHFRAEWLPNRKPYFVFGAQRSRIANIRVERVLKLRPP
jgi:hypothetical protein